MANNNGYQGKKIMVTGGDGFIGRKLIRRLKNEGARVIGLDLKRGMNICKAEKLLAFMPGVRFDLVYHLAGVSYVPYSWLDPQKTYAVNILGTLNVLEYCRKRKAKKLVFISSYVYGQPEYLPIDEGHPVNPANPYAWSKYIGEKLCEAYAKNFGLNCLILRPFNVYGAGQNHKFLIPSIMAQLKRADKIRLGEISPRRDFLFVDDLLDALLAAGKCRTRSAEIVNIGAGKSYSVKEIVRMSFKAAGKTKPLVSKKVKRQGEISNVVADIANAARVLKWRPQTKIEDGLRQVWQNETGGQK